MKDSDFGPHETRCDISIGISLTCNCMASTYIEQIQDLQKKLDYTVEILDRVEQENDKRKKVIKELEKVINAQTIEATDNIAKLQYELNKLTHKDKS